MYLVEISSWNPGFNKVACTTTLRSLARLSLGEAKRTTDNVLDGLVQRVALSSEEDANHLVQFLLEHGAVARAV